MVNLLSRLVVIDWVLWQEKIVFGLIGWRCLRGGV